MNLAKKLVKQGYIKINDPYKSYKYKEQFVLIETETGKAFAYVNKEGSPQFLTSYIDDEINGADLVVGLLEIIKKPIIQTTAKIAKGLGVSIDDLIK